MAQVINTNIASLSAQRHLSKSGGAMNTAMERLSSGLRINSAKDDAAGLAISDRMTSQIRGLNQAARNANDGISVAQVAEGALGEITGVLQRMRELAIQAANDTNSASDRLSIQKEVQQLQQEVTRIATQTQFNGKSILNGDFVAQKFQIGAYADQTLSFSIGSARAVDIGANSLNTTTLAASGTAAQAMTGSSVFNAGSASSSGGYIANQTLTITGATGTPTTVTLASGTHRVSAKEVADQVNVASAITAVTATALTKAELSGLSTSGTFQMSLYGSNQATTAGGAGAPVTITATITDKDDLSALADAINNVTSGTGISAELSANKQSIMLTQSEGYSIGIENFLNANGASGDYIYVQTVDASSTSMLATGSSATPPGYQIGSPAKLTAASGAGGASGSAVVVGTVSFSSSSGYSVSTTVSGTLFGSSTQASTLSDIGSASVATQKQANDSIKRIDGALAYVDNMRATLGALQNRFTSAISSAQSSAENVSAARSRIQDADFAAETAELSRTQILQQAGTAMLSQANATTQNVLKLLQG